MFFLDSDAPVFVTNISEWFSPKTNEFCPISYKIETSDGTTFTSVNDTETIYVNPEGEVYVNVTTTPQPRTEYYLTAFDTFGNMARTAIHVKVYVC